MSKVTEQRKADQMSKTEGLMSKSTSMTSISKQTSISKLWEEYHQIVDEMDALVRSEGNLHIVDSYLEELRKLYYKFKYKEEDIHRKHTESHMHLKMISHLIPNFKFTWNEEESSFTIPSLHIKSNVFGPTYFKDKVCTAEHVMELYTLFKQQHTTPELIEGIKNALHRIPAHVYVTYPYLNVIKANVSSS